MATEVDAYDTGSDGSTTCGFANKFVAQTFTTSEAYTITQVQLEIRQQFAGDYGNLRVSIKATSAGEPTGADLASVDQDPSGLGTSNGVWETFVFDTPYALSDATQYAIVVGITADNIGDGIWWRADSSSPSYSGGQTWVTEDGGSNWTGYSSIDQMFRTFKADATYVELSGTIAGVSSIPTADLTIPTFKELKGTIAGVSNIPSAPLGFSSVNLTEQTKKRRLIALGNNTLYYEDI
jgi:hypothetical protein